MNDFYIYIYLDPRKPAKYSYSDASFDHEPFYVGKGKDDRWKKHLSESYNNRDDNAHKCNIIRKIKRTMGTDPIVIKIKEELIESDAFRLETEYIKKIGRYDLKLGPLTNKTDGGEGQSGFIFSEQSREKIRESNRRWAKHHKNHFFGKTHTEETKKKMRKAKIGKYTGENNPNFGNRMSDEDKTKMSSSVKSSSKYIQSQMRRRKKYKLISPTGDEFVVEGYKMLKSICKTKNLSYYSLIEYEDSIVPDFRRGHGFESNERKNTNGWSIIQATHQSVSTPSR